MPILPLPGRSRRRTAAAVATMAALAGVAAMLPATGQAEKPPRLITAHAVQSVTCVPGPANTVRAAVAVRMRIGVVVVVRAPGRVVRRLALRRMHVRRERHLRVVEVVVANRGNVTETLERGRIRVELRHGRFRARLRSEPRELRPHTSGVVQLRYGGRLRGRVAARAWIVGPPGTVRVVQTSWIRL